MDYTDIIKVGVIMISFLMGAATAVGPVADLLHWVTKNVEHIFLRIFLLFIIPLGYLSVTLVSDYFSKEAAWQYHIAVSCSAFLATVIFVDLAEIKFSSFSPWDVLKPKMAAHFVLFTVFISGAMASYTKFPQNFRSTLVTNGAVYYNISIVMILSKYSVFIVDNDIKVVRSDDIKDISFNRSVESVLSQRH